jgi:hypothetical protein
MLTHGAEIPLKSVINIDGSDYSRMRRLSTPTHCELNIYLPTLPFQGGATGLKVPKFKSLMVMSQAIERR